ncbi:MAG: DUF3341 domain-containing protein [Chloroflexi bacterium]|nr:DUF3341 domain-containing protein [Chloroflexota bacterium]
MSASRSSVTNIVGVFGNVEAASQATYQLAHSGFSRDNMTVMTAEPYPLGAFATRTKKSFIHYLSLLGGAGGLLTGLAFAAGTALLYPLPTGGKPIVAWPTVGVITYEFTMLGIIIFTTLAFLFFARLPRRQPGLYVPSVTAGKIAVVVPCRGEERAVVAERMLQVSGAEEVYRRDTPARRWDEL